MEHIFHYEPPIRKSIGLHVHSFPSLFICKAMYRLFFWGIYLNLLLMILLTLQTITMGYQITIWNTTCPSHCMCHLQLSDISDHRLLKTANCSYQTLILLETNFSHDTEKLLLVGNDLTNISGYVPNLLNVQELDVSRNHIQSVDKSHLLFKLAVLKYLNLGKNDLNAIVRDTFFRLTNLEMLILSENKISYIEDQAFHGLSSLIMLDLSRNRLASLYSEWLFGLVRLKELYLYENRIHFIKSATFRPLRQLQHLSLHGNFISHISDDGFWGLDALNTLHLERNYLNEIPIKSLKYLFSLKLLYLSGNSIERIRKGDIADLPVEEIFLNNLPLTVVHSSGFTNLAKLHTLEMKNCAKLAYIDPRAFVNVTNLHSVILHHNHLLTISNEIIKRLPFGAEIELRGNPLLCDCNVQWIWTEMELSEKNLSRVKLPDLEQIICDTPENMHGTPVHHIDATFVIGNACAPTILPTMGKAIEKLVGDPLTLDCRGIGKPIPSLQWILPNDVEIYSNLTSFKDRISIRPSGSLEFHHIKLGDRGIYECVAQNIMGRTSAYVSIIVKPMDINVFPTVVSSTFITIIWNGTARKNLSQIRIIYKPLISNNPSRIENEARNNQSNYEEITVRASRFDYTISNLSPESTYELCIAHEGTSVYYIMFSCMTVKTRNADYMVQGVRHSKSVDIIIILSIILVIIFGIYFAITALQCPQRHYVCPDKHVPYQMSDIPMENMYSPLMGNAAP